MKDDFFQNEYFEQLNQRLDTLEKKIDLLTNKVNWIYAFSGGVVLIVSFVLKVMLK